MAIETDDLRQRLVGEHRHPAGIFLQDDLQQDAACDLPAGLGISDLEVLAGQHHALDIGQRDVAAGLGVVQAAVEVLLQRALAAGGSVSARRWDAAGSGRE